MDAFVQIALIEKAKRVFAGDPGLMLSFPLLAPIRFNAAALAVMSAPQTAQDYVVAADFARAANFLPVDILASATERTLWEVYADVLARADVASGASPGGGSPAASSLLYETTPDGVRIDSEAYKRYKHYREVWLLAREDYASHKLTGEMSDDPVVRARWREIEEPKLKGLLDAAETDWEILGNRTAIEAAIQADLDAGRRNPWLRWAEWARNFNPDTDLVSEVTGGQFAPTGLSPRDFTSADDWLFFDLSSGEIDRLVAEAPERFRALLDGATSSRYERVAFEYRSVAINRPWFNPDVFTSKIWRTRDADLTLSDGADPARGACPAYATAIVFVRNVEITERGEAAKSVPDLGFTLDVEDFLVHEIVDPLEPPPIDRKPIVITPLIEELVNPREQFPWLLWDELVIQPANTGNDLQMIGDTGITLLQPVDFSREAVEPIESIVDVETIRQNTRAFHRVLDNSFSISLEELDVTPTPILSFDAIHNQWVRDETMLQLELVDPSPPAPPNPVGEGEVSVLAFICKRLPKAPDPDPALTWE